MPQPTAHLSSDHPAKLSEQVAEWGIYTPPFLYVLFSFFSFSMGGRCFWGGVVKWSKLAGNIIDGMEKKANLLWKQKRYEHPGNGEFRVWICEPAWHSLLRWGAVWSGPEIKSTGFFSWIERQQEKKKFYFLLKEKSTHHLYWKGGFLLQIKNKWKRWGERRGVRFDSISLPYKTLKVGLIWE